MNEWGKDWNQRLAQPPLKQRHFRSDMMDRVENRLQLVEKKRERKVWALPTVLIVSILFVAVSGDLWMNNHTSPATVTVRSDPGLVPSSYEPGTGGDVYWWDFTESAVKQETDRTIATLAKALLKRELGVWGGSTPDIWENSDVKQPLERYDVSSPWVNKVYIGSIKTVEKQTVYRLSLVLRDSAPTIYQETIDVHVQQGTHKISLIELVNTDDVGVPITD